MKWSMTKSAMRRLLALCVAMGLSACAAPASADTLADWTFETTFASLTGSSTSIGPIAPEVGSGQASSVHATAATYSSPTGNGSAKSFSATNYAAGDYFQFKVNSTGYQDLTVNWDQTSSNTGPRDFKLSYSTDGSSFTDFASYSVLANASPNTPWSSSTYNAAFNFNDDLSAISAIENQANVYFRLSVVGAVSANGGALASGGTDRLDNFTVTATPIVGTPEPSSFALAGLGGLGLAWTARRRRQAQARLTK